MALLRRSLAALAIFTSHASGARDRLQGVAASASWAQLGTACVDTDNGATNEQGWNCDFFDLPAKCDEYAGWYNENFNAYAMCCTCGGGSALQPPTSCPATCYEHTCDYWVESHADNTCESLEAEYGCSCQGCSRCGEAAAAAQQQQQQRRQQQRQYDGFQGMGPGECRLEDGSESEYASHRYTNAAVCARLCAGASACTGFAADDMFCFTYYDSGLKANPEETMHAVAAARGISGSTECWAKIGHAVAAARGGGANQNDEPAVPDAEGAEADQTTAAVAVDAPDTLGAVNDYYVQTFVFKERGVYRLENVVETEETCVDTVTGERSCSAFATAEACESDPLVRESCRRSCGFCEPWPVGQDLIQIVKAADKSYHVIMGGQPDGGLKGLVLTNPFGVKHTTWLVKDEGGELLYTIQRRAHKQDCRYLFLDCKAAWKIYRGGKKGMKLINYGIQHKTSFKFYQSRADFKSGRAPWIASYKKMLPTKSNGNSLYKVTVKPGKDAALMLLAAYAIFKKSDLVTVKPGEDSE